jgi:DNA repair exonuclease SbcCD ATPase subunit
VNPRSVTLENVRTFDHVHLDLPEGLLAVLGTNGAGKSTLISAIDVALFGPEGRSLAPWYPRGLGEEPMVITLVFEHGGDLYRVRRAYSPKGRGQSKCDIERERRALDGEEFIFSDNEVFWEPVTLESQAATQEWLEGMIGLSRATFRASSYLAQGDAGAFCDAAPGARKAILSEVVGLADWARWLERARTEKRACEMELAQAFAILDRAAEELAAREQIEKARRTAGERVGSLTGQLENATAALAAARQALTDAQARAERRGAFFQAQERADAAVAEFRLRMASLTGELEALAGRLADRERLEQTAGRLEALELEREALRAEMEQWQTRERVSAELAQVEDTAAAHTAQAERWEEQALRVLTEIGEARCDRCEQILGADAAERAARSYREEAARETTKAQDLAARHEALTAQLAGLPETRPNAERLQPLFEEIRAAQQAGTLLAALGEADARRQAAEQELDKMRAELPNRERVAADAKAELESLGPHDPQYDRQLASDVRRLEGEQHGLHGELTERSEAVGRYDAQLERLATIETEAQEQAARRDALLDTLDVLAAMERACSANGIPALILENVAIPQVEAEANRLLGLLGGPATSVELRTLREKRTGGISDTLDIVLMTETGEANYETFSGGERARIAFALRLSLAQLLAARKGADTGLLVIDEIDGLDAAGVAALVMVLEDLQRSVPRIIVVSHDANLRDAFAQSITLENIDGRSRIVDLPTNGSQR